MIFFFNDTATTEIYTLSLHDALPIYPRQAVVEGRPGHVQLGRGVGLAARVTDQRPRSEEHTSELQSRQYLVCRLLLEKKNSTLSSSVDVKVCALPSSIPLPGSAVSST